MCGSDHAACGDPSTTIAIDQRLEVATMGGTLKKYTVKMPNGTETVMKLNDEDVKRYGDDATPADGSSAKSRPAANKARTPANKAASAQSSKDE